MQYDLGGWLVVNGVLTVFHLDHNHDETMTVAAVFVMTGSMDQSSNLFNSDRRRPPSSPDIFDYSIVLTGISRRFFNAKKFWWKITDDFIVVWHWKMEVDRSVLSTWPILLFRDTSSYWYWWWWWLTKRHVRVNFVRSAIWIRSQEISLIFSQISYFLLFRDIIHRVCSSDETVVNVCSSLRKSDSCAMKNKGDGEKQFHCL